MELEQIPNYKERVTFVCTDSNKFLKSNIKVSSKLYYNSQAIKKIKRKIKDYPAYFVTSYPSLVDVNLSTYLKIPIFTGNLIEMLSI